MLVVSELHKFYSMKAISTITVIILAVIVVIKIFSTEDISTQSMSSTNCIELQQRIMEMKDLSTADMEKAALCDQMPSDRSGDDCNAARKQMKLGDPSAATIEKLGQCNRDQLARLELSGAKNRIPSNTSSRPAGALAHYKWLGNLEFFTVYDDRIQLKPATYPKNVTTIRFEDIEKLEDNRRGMADVFGGIGITYRDNSGKRMSYSIAIYSDADIGLPKEKTEQNRLYQLLDKQWKKKRAGKPGADTS